MPCWKLVLLVALALRGGSLASAAAAYDASADFAPNANPNGAWSYGWSSGLGTAFVPSTIAGVTDGLDYWAGSVPEPSSPGHFPLVFHNGTDHTIVASGTVYAAAGQLALHPGPGGEYAVLRFTAPEAGLYSLRALFTGIDIGPTSTDVHVMVDGAPVFDGAVNGFGTGPSFDTVARLAAGRTIDFSVGFGNGSFYNDSTALQATIALVPEPAGRLLWCSGLAGMLAITRRVHHRPSRRAGAGATHRTSRSMLAMVGAALLGPLAAQAAIIGGPFTSPLNGDTYYLLDQNDWTGSEAEARGLGGHLASIGSEAENAWIAATFANFGGVPRALWIGLNDAALEGTFVWSSGAPVSFTNWGPAEPNDHLGVEDWAHLFPPTDSRYPAWNDAPDVTDAFGFVFNGVAQVTAVPEPHGGLLMIAALTGLAALCQHRSSTRLAG